MRETFVDSPEFLETLGISFDDEKNFPKGYLKLWPQDFVVEEISKDGSIETVDLGDFFHEEKKNYIINSEMRREKNYSAKYILYICGKA